MRAGAPIVAVVVAGFLLPAAGGVERPGREPAPIETRADTITEYSRLTKRALTLREERRSAELALTVTRRSVNRAERRLAARLRALYQQGRPDPLEVVLGAASLDHALVSIENLERIGRDETKQLQDLRRGRARLERLARRLRAQEANAAVLRRQAAALLRARAGRTLSGRAGPRPNEPTVDDPAPVALSSPAPVAAQRLTVVALGYSIAGGTASGLPAGVGTVAVDPGVIPLGTVLTIPGYGRGVAADTGAAIRGNVIDLWFPTAEQARAWGRRVVTIDVHQGK